MENTYLEHHGTKGMRWGVRRYQNPDGSLTALGRKRATKNRVKAINARTKAKLKKLREDEKNKVKIEKTKAKSDAKIEKAKSRLDDKLDDAKKNPTLLDKIKNKKPTGEKSVKDMSNEEIKAKIDRIRLEQQLASLTPQTKSLGKRFTESLVNDVIKPVAKEQGKKWLNKKVKEALNLDDDSAKAADDVLKEMKRFNDEYNTRIQYEKNKQEIKDKQAKAEKEAKDAADKAAKEKADAKAQKKAEKEAAKEEKAAQKEAERRFEEARKEAKAKEAAKEASSNQTKQQTSKQEQKTERYEATGDDVFGEGTSRFSGWKDNGKTYDAEYRDIKVSDTTTSLSVVSSGRNYIDQFLLEDKRR